MGIDNLNERLAGMQAAFDDAPVGNVVEDGDYDTVVDDLDIFEGKDGTIYFKVVFKITLGDNAGQTVDLIQPLTIPERLMWAKEALAKLGVPVDELDLGTFPAEFAKIGGRRVRISVVNTTKGGRTYTNAYVRDLLMDAEQVSPEADTTGMIPGQTSIDDAMPDDDMPTREEIGY